MRIINIFFGLAVVAAMTSCQDDMEYNEFSNYDWDYIAQSYDEVTGLVTNIYTYLDYDFGQLYSGGMLASACDEAEYAYTSNDIQDFTNGSWNASNPLSTIWDTNYEAIQACNHYLDNFDGLEFETMQLNDDYDAQMYRYHNSFPEVRALRAYFYFNLVRAYGDVPYFTHELGVDDVNSLERVPALAVLDSIMATCDEVADTITVDYTNLGLNGISPAETGRINKCGVLALKARAALYAASPLFNEDNDASRWKKAAEANYQLIVHATDTMSCSLADDYSDLWGTTNWQESEMIFMRRYYTSSIYSSLLESYNYPVGIDGASGGNCPSQNLVDAYEMQATGLPITDEDSGYDEENPYDGRDPRFELTIAKNGDAWPNEVSELQIYYGGTHALPTSGGTPTGYYLKKYLDPSISFASTSTYTSSLHTWITYRLGEFYLNFAEAANEYLGSPSDASFGMSAIEAVNKIRARAGMPDFPSDMTYDEFVTKYRRERMVELAFEGHRFYDVRRWKIGEEALSSIDEMRLTLNSDGTITYTRQTVSRTFSEKMYLYPIPQSEILKNSNLYQNPGW